jgi:hypothetical protein
MTRSKKFVLSLMMSGLLLGTATNDSHALRLYQLDECERGVLTPDALAWLTGAWESRAGQRVHEMQWSKPSGGTLLGFGRSLRQGQTVDYEFMHLHQTDGTLWLTLKPANQPEARFRLTQLEEGSALFTAPFEIAPHTFTQRVIYRLEADATLTVRLEGQRAGLPHCQQVSFKRVKSE